MVSIEGVDYNFIFDTGASNTISYEIFEKLNYKNKRLSILLGDSQGNIGHGSYTEIPELSLGELTFRDIGINIVDLRKNLEFRCLNIEGIFGANHMAKAIWEINYENQEILVTNDMKNINMSEPYYPIEFFTERHEKKPKINIAINGRAESKISYDTGSNGYISLSDVFLDSLDNYENVDYFGFSASVGLFGQNPSQAITRITKVPLPSEAGSSYPPGTGNLQSNFQLPDKEVPLPSGTGNLQSNFQLPDT